MPRLSETNRHITIGLFEAGQFQRSVARTHECSQKHHFTALGEISQAEYGSQCPCSGLPQATTAVQDRYIQIHHLRHPTVMATSTF